MKAYLEYLSDLYQLYEWTTLPSQDKSLDLLQMSLLQPDGQPMFTNSDILQLLEAAIGQYLQNLRVKEIKLGNERTPLLDKFIPEKM